MSRPCSICATERGPVINAMLAAGRTPNWIEGEMKRLGSPTKGETVRKHLARCLNGKRQNVALLPGNGRPVDASPNRDFAAAVRAEANRMLAEGKLNIRTEHGLQAQALLDRRAEKQADRQLLVELGRLLSGGRSSPDEIVVGEWREVGEQTDNADADGLAPLALVVER